MQITVPGQTRRRPVWALLGVVALMLGAAPEAVAADPKIQVVGDSVMTWNGRNAIPEVIARALGEPVDNNARAGARLTRSSLIARSVEAQFRRGSWDWVIVNGGANDLNRNCGCNRCDAEIAAMISADGQRGTWPDLVAGLRAGGAERVMIVGYYGPTGRGGRTDRCADELAIVDARLSQLAAAREGVFFVDADPVMGPRTPELFSSDLIHPNARGSAVIGAHVAEALSRIDPAR
ncbi:SGNH/GDSL hydrolase family protein [Dinoroseobacter sp. S124A]|uniref:SGNH/GDSL hydrolase family protein n=1 Tax=Dinoroseobacter sp. S124A TaxID=3415128 RepID=UPI003C7CA95B